QHRARPTGEEDGAVGGGLVLNVQAAFCLGIYWPACCDGEPRLHQCFGQRVPGTSCLMRKHQGQYAIRLQYSSAFCKDRCHAVLVVPPGERLATFLATKGCYVGDSFIFFVSQSAAE